MADCFKSNLSVQEPVYCKDEQGEPDYSKPMYSWMSVRAAGPNILQDTYLCGETTIVDPIFPNPLPPGTVPYQYCSLAYSPAVWTALLQDPMNAQVNEIREATNQGEGWKRINNGEAAAFTLISNTTTDDTVVPDTTAYPWTMNALIAIGFGNPQGTPTKTIGIYNNSGEDLLLDVNLNATVANDTSTGTADSMTYYFSFGLLQSGTGPALAVDQSAIQKLGIISKILESGGAVQNAEEAISIRHYISVPAGATVIPCWYPYNPVNTAINSLIWRSVKFSARIIGCSPNTETAQTVGISTGPV